MKPFTVCVEGNIGSGKSTILKWFEENCAKDFEVLCEPINKWRNVGGQNLLKLRHEEPKRWSYLFQSFVQLTMLQVQLGPSPKPVKIMERSIFKEYFWATHETLGNLENVEVQVLKDWLKAILDTHGTLARPDLIVYLRTDPEVALQRVFARQREEESQLQRIFVQTLNQNLDDWLVHKTKFQPIPAPVVVIDANVSQQKLLEDLPKLRDDIKERIRI